MMVRGVDFRKRVEYELMLGREATAAIAHCPMGYLPIGCLERHGDHLPMGLDTVKAHGLCCLAARAIGGVVFPPHHYAGIHRMEAGEEQRFTEEWGNLYTVRTACATLAEIIGQIARIGVRVLVLYSGHYPGSQVEMTRELATSCSTQAFRVIPFAEPMVLEGDHAGISETSLMLYLDKHRVDMTRIGPVNHQEHRWKAGHHPEEASAAIGEEQAWKIVEHLARAVAAARSGDAG
jgi:creatinine amidohydrolase